MRTRLLMVSAWTVKFENIPGPQTRAIAALETPCCDSRRVVVKRDNYLHKPVSCGSLNSAPKCTTDGIIHS